ncbi:MAG: AbiJ-NTD4 domain-containing protein [Janthinobacterium lividum]
MIFSQRYHRALEQRRLQVDLPQEVRRKLWSWISAHNTPLYIQPDPNDSWISNSSVLEQAEAEMLVEHGWDSLPVRQPVKNDTFFVAFRELILDSNGELVFDALELVGNWMNAEEREGTRRKINQIFTLHFCPWRLSDGEFFKLDQDFVGTQLSSSAHEALAANGLAGATDEYAKARQYAGAGETREAIYFAGHSFESVMKVLTGSEHANADRLIKELAAKGYFDDLPEGVRAGFADQVLKALPFLRNKLGGHGQGAAVITIPPAYGELTIQLAAALHNFLIAKHLERSPPTTPPAAASHVDDVPF